MQGNTSLEWLEASKYHFLEFQSKKKLGRPGNEANFTLHTGLYQSMVEVLLIEGLSLRINPVRLTIAYMETCF